MERTAMPMWLMPLTGVMCHSLSPVRRLPVTGSLMKQRGCRNRAHPGDRLTLAFRAVLGVEVRPTSQAMAGFQGQNRTPRVQSRTAWTEGEEERRNGRQADDTPGQRAGSCRGGEAAPRSVSDFLAHPAPRRTAARLPGVPRAGALL